MNTETNSSSFSQLFRRFIGGFGISFSSEGGNKPPKKYIETDISKINDILEKEHADITNIPDNFPKLIDTVNCEQLLDRIRNERPFLIENNPGFKALFTLQSDEPSNFTRAIQEEEILKTRLKHFNKKLDKPIDLPSFWDVWNNPKSGLADLIIHSRDQQEAKWTYAIPNTNNKGYKLATNFMPGYARALYEYFGATRVLDPCAGWGDRLTGAMVASCVKKYVGFDPNRNLRYGYSEIMRYGGYVHEELTQDKMRYNNSFEIVSLPFEIGIQTYENNSFDFAFTSPPFFDYEMYNPANPEYKDWIKDFYTPLFKQVCRCLQPGCYFGIHIGDTTAGKIMDFLMNDVEKITDFVYESEIGLQGMMSNKIRSVWMYRKKGGQIKAAKPPSPTSPQYHCYKQREPTEECKKAVVALQKTRRQNRVSKLPVIHVVSKQKTRRRKI